MPKKDRIKKIWEISQQNQQRKQIQQNLQHQSQNQNIKYQIRQEVDRPLDFSQIIIRQQKQDKFKTNPQLISQLNSNIYKDILLKQFQQNNQAFQNIEQFSLKRLRKTNQRQKTKKQRIREGQKQIIIDFIESTSLTQTIYNDFLNKDLQYKSVFDKNCLHNLNKTLLDSTKIKFLNVFGPTGTGKTFNIKSILKSYQKENLYIWKNGMSMTQSKIKRFTKKLQQNFDHEIIKKMKYTLKNTNQKKLNVFRFTSKNSKILVIDEFDQIQNLSLRDILRFSYIQQYQRHPFQQLFIISKIILISNQYLSLQQKFNIKHLQQIDNLYVQKLIFKQYLDSEISLIIQQKIQKINKKFLQYLKQNNNQSKIFDMFISKIQGIYNNKNMKFIVNKICYPEQKDIRRILRFYCQSFGKWLESINQSNNEGVPHKKSNEYLIHQDYLMEILTKEKKEQSKNNFTIHILNQNPVQFYLSHLQTQGKIILKSIYETILKKKRARLHQQQYERHQSNHVKKLLKQQMSKQSYSMYSDDKKCANSIFLIEFYKNISSKIDKDKLYPWLYEWQSIGLIQVYEKTHPYMERRIYGKEKAHDIKIMDNYLIELKEENEIKKILYH